MNITTLLTSPIFGFSLTLAAYAISLKVKKIKLLSKIPPICYAALMIIFIMKGCSINYSTYNTGGQLITYILGPATIALALPLVKNIHVLKQNWKIILTGITIATLVGIFSVIFTAEILRTAHPIILSMLPKSVTTPIAVEISKTIGGIPELTACMVILTGIIGSSFGHRLLKLIKVKHNISIGLAIGASSHVIGTSRCVEKDEVQAATSGLALIMVGFLTALFAPIIAKFFI